jgi:hypothetical protein
MNFYFKMNKIKGKVCISLLTKDSSKWLPHSLKNVEKYASYFEDYYCLIVDGYSKDVTKLIANSWCKGDTNRRKFVTQPTEGLERMKSLVEARNFVIDQFKSQFGSDVYLLLIDSDSPNTTPFDEEGFLSSFKTDKEWVCMFPNQKGEYYDLWALRDTILNEDYQLKFRGLQWNGEMQNALKPYQQSKYSKDGFWPVYSAFGGAGLYKSKYILDSNTRYKDETEYMLNNKKYIVPVCEHVPFHYGIKGEKYINCKWIIGDHL